MKSRAMIRFLCNVYDDNNVCVWRKSYFYRIILETKNEYYIETDGQDNYCAIAKDHMESVAELYKCDCKPMSFCNHCRYLTKTHNECVCGLQNSELWQVLD